VFGEATTGRCGFHHSYITNADPEGAATDCRLWAKLMKVQEERTRINVKEECGHYATMVYEVNGDKALRRK